MIPTKVHWRADWPSNHTFDGLNFGRIGINIQKQLNNPHGFLHVARSFSFSPSQLLQKKTKSTIKPSINKKTCDPPLESLEVPGIATRSLLWELLRGVSALRERFMERACPGRPQPTGGWSQLAGNGGALQRWTYKNPGLLNGTQTGTQSIPQPSQVSEQIRQNPSESFWMQRSM